MIERQVKCNVCGKPTDEHSGGLACCWRCGSAVVMAKHPAKVVNELGKRAECHACGIASPVFDLECCVRDFWNRRAVTFDSEKLRTALLAICNEWDHCPRDVGMDCACGGLREAIERGNDMMRELIMTDTQEDG